MPLVDMGLMRGIPEVTVIEPVDTVMLADIMKQTKDLYGVFYIRLSRKKSERLYESGSTFEIGKCGHFEGGQGCNDHCYGNHDGRRGQSRGTS